MAIMDWHSRAVLSWRLSNTMDADFCVAALEEAMNRYGVPEIFNTDQGSQFTSQEFTRALKDADVSTSMDGKGRWMDNVSIERLWRSMKWECIYLRELETGSVFTMSSDRIRLLTVVGPWMYTGKANRPRGRHEQQPAIA